MHPCVLLCYFAFLLLAAASGMLDNSIPDFAQTVVAAQASCPGCRENAYRVSEGELTALRIDFVKNQILKKLRLKERPPATIPLSGVPKPVADGATVMSDQENQQHKEREDYYGKTTQKIIFPNEDKQQCFVVPREETCSSTCFSMDFPADVDSRDVSVAELWVYKERDDLDSHNQTLVVSLVAHWDSKRTFKKTTPIAIQATNIEEGWVKIDLAWAVKNWFQYRELSRTIQVSCVTCAKEWWQSPISLKPENKPFVVIDTHSQMKKRRKKRNLNCGPGVRECCRDRLYISFAEIGWDDWILQPAGYHAYFCRGSCSTAASVTLSASGHNSMLRKVMHMHKERGQQGGNHVEAGKKLEIIPCCTATQYSSLQLLYMENNNTATQKTLPNMVVESCGCM